MAVDSNGVVRGRNFFPRRRMNAHAACIQECGQQRIGNGAHTLVAGMGGDAGAGKSTFRTGIVRFVVAEISNVNKDAAHSRTRLPKDIVPGLVRPETTAHEDRGVRPAFHGGKQGEQARLEPGLHRRIGEGRHIFSDGDNHDIRLERYFRLECDSDVIGVELPFEVRDIDNARFGPAPDMRGHGIQEKVDVILFQGTGRHAAVGSPANIRGWSVARDAVAENKNPNRLFLAHEQFPFPVNVRTALAAREKQVSAHLRLSCISSDVVVGVVCVVMVTFSNIVPRNGATLSLEPGCPHPGCISDRTRPA